MRNSRGDLVKPITEVGPKECHLTSSSVSLQTSGMVPGHLHVYRPKLLQGATNQTVTSQLLRSVLCYTPELQRRSTDQTEIPGTRNKFCHFLFLAIGQPRLANFRTAKVKQFNAKLNLRKVRSSK